MRTKETRRSPFDQPKPLLPKAMGAIVLALLGLTASSEAAQGPQPSICNRACWGARAPVCGISQLGTLSRAVIHHTASASDFNTTSQATSAANVRAVQNYHIDSRGWCDTGYHFMVCKLGYIFEGRAGSMSSIPVGAHDSVNANSFGFNWMGYFHPPHNQVPTTAMRNSIYDVIAWRMPSAWSTYGGGTYGGRPGVGTLCTHRDAFASACPGDSAYPFITSNINGGEARDGVHARRNGTPPPQPDKKKIGSPVGRYADGRMQIFAIGGEGALWTSCQTTPNGAFSGWYSFGGQWTSTPVVANNPNGSLVVFVIGMDGTLWAYTVTPNSGVGTWSIVNLGGSWPSSPAVGRNQNGRNQVFLVGGDKQLYTYTQTAANGSSWSIANLGGSWPGIPAVASNADGRLQVFLTGNELALWNYTQTAVNSASFGIANMGGTWAWVSSPVVGANADGRLQVFMTGMDAALWTYAQTAASGTSWSIASLGGTWASNPCVGRNADGRLQVFIVGGDSALWSYTQGTANSSSFGMGFLSGNWPVSSQAVSANQDGRLQVFSLGGETAMWTYWQTAVNGSTWNLASLGGNWTKL